MANEGKRTTKQKAAGKAGGRVAAAVGESAGGRAKSKGTKAVAKAPARIPGPPNVEALISKAINKNNLDVIERLLNMRRELKAEAAKEAYFRDLARFQKECPIIRKSIEVLNKESKGGGTRYRYAPLDELVRLAGPILMKHGFSWTVKTRQGKGWVKAILEAHHIEGHTEVTDFTVPIQADAYMTAPQKVAGALTFSSRYAFRNAFGIMTGDADDDGRSAGISSPNGRRERDVTPSKEKPKEAPKDLGMNKIPDDAEGQFKKQLAKMKWLPQKTVEMYLNQVRTFVEKGDLKSLRGLAQSLSKQRAMKQAEQAKEKK